jgi:putative transcriptional regulator
MSGRKILDGLAEAVEFSRGRKNGAIVREVRVPDSIDVQAVRKKLKMSQKEFAMRFGFTLATVQNWEQGHRKPEGSARVLLKIIEKRPDIVEKVLAVG